ncbi:hypothetical protein O181_017795 [Austropuccinia psidii MF-1]|uniref:Cytochrome P450 n=1 Tax=Austropuccinia psidii MF-1 TaxID=1389203 RepID=A0A9Q3C8I2_9BASI|nr:hypothetical protein [Austropuccinia psidii MF-1]
MNTVSVKQTADSLFASVTDNRLNVFFPLFGSSALCLAPSLKLCYIPYAFLAMSGGTVGYSPSQASYSTSHSGPDLFNMANLLMLDFSNLTSSYVYNISALACLVTLLSIFIFIYAHHPIKNYQGKKILQLPGPVRLPIFGNLFQVSKQRPWVQYIEWKKQFGPIYGLQMGLTNWVVVGSPKVATDLLEKRSSIYSSRPRHIMAFEHVSRGLRMTLMPSNDLWRRERKLLHLLTQPKAAATYLPIQAQESAQLCLDLLNCPQQHWQHSQRFAGSIVLQIVYNRRALRNSDPAITDLRKCTDLFVQTTSPGKYLVESIPLLNYFPAILAPWKQEAKKLFQETFEIFERLYLETTQRLRIDPDSVGGCFVARIEELKEDYQLSYEQAIFLAGIMFSGGSDTTSGAIETFILACAANPDKMAKAQEELDRIVGRKRLPNFSDESTLLYCTAIVRELLRWRSPLPAGLSHMTTEDDIYEGYYIPKGSTIVPNHWALHLDEETYVDPQKYEPERFLNPDHTKLIGTQWSQRGHHSFGFGRRVCPGLHIAEKSLFIAFTRILWTCSITATGPLDPDAFSSGFSCRPLAFPVDIKPRGDWVKEIIEQAVEDNGFDAFTI